MATNVPVREVARRLSISPGTVSKALRGTSGSVSVETAEKILDFSHKNGYMSKIEAAKVMAKKKSNVYGNQIFCVTCRRGILAYDIVFAGICEQMQQYGLYSSIFVIHNQKEIETFPFDKAESVIIIGSIGSDILGDFTRRNKQVVMIDNRISGARISSVNSNNMEAIDETVTLLANKGHQRIAYLCMHEDKDNPVYTFQQRQMGYIAGLANAGLPFDERLLLTGSNLGNGSLDFDPDRTIKNIEKLAERILEIDPLPTAVIAANDLMAYVVRQVLTSKGVEVPRDISIVGYDGWHRHATVSNVGFTPASTMSVDWRELGREAVDLALEMQYDPQESPKHIEVPVEYDDIGTVMPPKPLEVVS